jgi:hypothetical protein
MQKTSQHWFCIIPNQLIITIYDNSQSNSQLELQSFSLCADERNKPPSRYHNGDHLAVTKCEQDINLYQ